ncbi:MAG: fatty-acyl-CoA synthase [Pseudohongiellaceae bacterium]|jgi:fatty-acyl-CoA synthase
MPPFKPRPQGTLSELLRDLAHHRGEVEALVIPDFVRDGHELRLSFSALDARVDHLAAGLISLGIEAGEHVALWAGNVADWVPLEFALARIGAVLVTINTALQHDEVAYVLRQSQAVAVLHTTGTGSNEASALLDNILADSTLDLGAVRHRVWLPASPEDSAPNGLLMGAHTQEHGPLTSLDDVVALGRELPAEQLTQREKACRPSDVVNIQYTSGTTGFPKGVMLSHSNLLSSAWDLGDQLRLTGDDSTCLMVPLFHCFGCVVAVLGSYSYAVGIHVLPGFDAENVLRLVDQERCTIIHGVPTMFSALLAHPDRSRFDTHSLRTGLMAGAPCPEPLMRAVIDELHCDGMCIAYGLTEAAPGVAGTNPEDNLAVRCGSLGRPLPGVSVRIVDPETCVDVPPGEEGELWLAGDNIMVGYFNAPDATALAIKDGRWLRTGDLARRDEQGLLYIVGRAKDIIIRGGENIAPAEIENILREHPDVHDVAVVGVTDRHFGEEVGCAVVLKADRRLQPQELSSCLQGRIASFKIPKFWKAFDAFPLTGSGKVQKYKLREMMGDATVFTQPQQNPAAP